MKYQSLLICSALSLSLLSCKNPADETTDAKVTEGKTVATNQDENAVTYVFADSSTLKFIGSKVTGSQNGAFDTFTGSFKMINAKPVSGKVTIDMNSVSTEKAKLTGHLKNEDFFNVEKFPSSVFEATDFSKVDDTHYNLSGNLTMLGVTKNITFPTTVTKTDNALNVSATFDINRQDWGISYAGKADDLIRDEVVIMLNISAVAEK